MATLHTGCGREVHHGGCTCREDAEIARLKAEVESKNATIEATRRHVDRLRRALAAGPAALRGCKFIATREHAVTLVEDAQDAALKEKP